jgi:hypothetical protein
MTHTNLKRPAGAVGRFGCLVTAVGLAAVTLAAGGAAAQTRSCGADGCAPGQAPNGPLPSYLFNGFQSLDIHTLQQMANWSNAMLGLGTSTFLGKGDTYHTLGGSAYDRSWRDRGGTIIDNGRSIAGTPTRTTSKGWELHDIYDAGRRFGLPDDQSLIVAGFANVSQSRTHFIDSSNMAGENDYSLSFAAAYRIQDYYVIGAVNGVAGHVHLDALHGGGKAGYNNKGFESRVLVGRRFRLVDPATHSYSLSADVGAYGAYLVGHSDAFTDSSSLQYGQGSARSWLAGAKFTLEADVPHKGLLWSPYAGLTFDHYIAPHISVEATPSEDAITYVGRKSLAGAEAGIAISNAGNLTVDLKAYSQQNSQLRTAGVVLALSHPF